MEELRDLYDKNKNLTGEKIHKSEQPPQGKYILVVVGLIQNDKKELLVQQRSFAKETNPGKWSNTGGHPKFGESSVEGMIEEIKEELGITVNENQLKLIDTLIQEDNRQIIDLYYLNIDYDIEDMILQKEEVEQVKWLTINEAKELMESDEFVKSNFELDTLIKNFLDRQVYYGVK